jgi:hypothetical protein
MKFIRIVTKVERTPVSGLQGMTRISSSEVRLPSGISWEPLKAKPHAQLSVSDRIEDKSVIWTAKLVFRTCDDVADGGRWAYRCRLSDGTYRLIGSDERPYPTATVLDSNPENVTENQLREVTVNWQSPHRVPYIRE